jgi:hypothetical protein
MRLTLIVRISLSLADTGPVAHLGYPKVGCREADSNSTTNRKLR